MDLPEPAVDLAQLVSLFYPTKAFGQIGEFDGVDPAGMPLTFAKLLDHHSHMTVAVESHFQSAVDVRVVQTVKDEIWYGREILLSSQNSGQIVQYGIVRLRHGVLARPVWKEIERGEIPLGRVLIEHDVLRQVELIGLWRVTCGTSLANFFSIPLNTVTFGRTARIFCDFEPAIELLEVVTSAV